MVAERVDAVVGGAEQRDRLTVHQCGGAPLDLELGADWEERTAILLETTLGRVYFNDTLPADYPFVNEEVGKKRLGAIVNDLAERYTKVQVAASLDALKDAGLKPSDLAAMQNGQMPQGVDMQKLQALAPKLESLSSSGVSEAADKIAADAKKSCGIDLTAS